ncbi:sensor histidine kinase [Desulfogranum japonicum]|uniref:sensor histidine kinase n=1 Tax=Desulfogranum japonicum TaxID=231447 RepID=UPI0003FFA876|nr:HAMP domain-containing sensor histidine kinase [Desulfogranum japonicum]
MKIRYLITLWISGAGLLAGLIFSLVIFYELVEQPYELLDDELGSQAYTLLAALHPLKSDNASQPTNAVLDSLGRLYWLKIFDKQGHLIHASSMTRFVNLPLKKKSPKYNIDATIPVEIANFDQGDTDRVSFRVHVLPLSFSGAQYLVQIARPMEKLQDEIHELVISIAIGLILFMLVLVSFGYFAAGKILKPIRIINSLSREINEHTLEKRIPQGKNRDELHELAMTLNQMFDRLQFSFRQQKEFVANASHELKTPLAIQRLFFDEASKREDLPEDLQRQILSQVRVTRRMDQLVKNLLHLSALELKSTFEPSLIHLSHLIESVLEDFEYIIEYSDIRLSTDIQKDIMFHGHEDMIRRVLINLIDNAIKYSSGGAREIRVHLEKNADAVKLRVYNTGNGIPTEEQDNIFQQFYRIEKSRSATYGGSGLGLTIVKRIIDLHGGSITVESENATWTSFTILLPEFNTLPALK